VQDEDGARGVSLPRGAISRRELIGLDGTVGTSHGDAKLQGTDHSHVLLSDDSSDALQSHSPSARRPDQRMPRFGSSANTGSAGPEVSNLEHTRRQIDGSRRSRGNNAGPGNNRRPGSSAAGGSLTPSMSGSGTPGSPWARPALDRTGSRRMLLQATAAPPSPMPSLASPLVKGGVGVPHGGSGFVAPNAAGFGSPRRGTGRPGMPHGAHDAGGGTSGMGGMGGDEQFHVTSAVRRKGQEGGEADALDLGTAGDGTPPELDLGPSASTSPNTSHQATLVS